MQAFIVVFKHGKAFLGAGHVFGVGIDDVAGQQLLPEGETAGWAWEVGISWRCKYERWLVIELGRGECASRELGWERGRGGGVMPIPPARP